MRLNSNGKGTFYDSEMLAGLYNLVFLPDNDMVEFLYEGKTMNLNFDFKDISKTLKTDSKANELLNQRTAFIDDLLDRKRIMEEKKLAEPAFDLDKSLVTLDADFVSFNRKMYASYPTNLAVKFFKAMEDPMIPEQLKGDAERFYYYRSHYLDNVDFSAIWTLRMPFFEEKINEYIERLTSQQPDSLIAAWDYIISLSEGNDEMFKSLFIIELNKYAKNNIMGYDAINFDFIEKYYLTGKATWADKEQLDKLKESAWSLENNLIGRIVSNFDMRMSDQKEISLHQLKSDYTILIFVQKDCPRCRSEEKTLESLKASIPENVKIVEVFFTIEPEQAISKKKEEGVYWQVGVLRSESELAPTQKNYNLKSFHVVYLLDKDKKIIAKQIDVTQALEIIGIR